jgi:hypothetical protein
MLGICTDEDLDSIAVGKLVKPPRDCLPLQLDIYDLTMLVYGGSS